MMSISSKDLLLSSEVLIILHLDEILPRVRVHRLEHIFLRAFKVYQVRLAVNGESLGHVGAILEGRCVAAASQDLVNRPLLGESDNIQGI